jgi:hypothetical protein
MRKKREPVVSKAPEAMGDGKGAIEGSFFMKRKMSWAALIRMVYEVEPLRCPECGGEIKIISFMEKCQPSLVEKILRHCGLWKESVPRPPPAVSRVAEGEPSYDCGYFDRVCN